MVYKECSTPGHIFGKLSSKNSVMADLQGWRQLCDDVSDSVLIENNGVTRKWVATPFLSDSIVCNKNRITNIIAELSQC